MAIDASKLPLAMAPRAADAAPLPGNAPAVDALERRFAAAIADFAAGHWQHAFTELSALANLGHAPAARIASMLARRGTSMFGGPFQVDPEVLARWRQIGG